MCRRVISNIVIAASSTVRPLEALDQRKTPATGLGGKIEIRPPLGASQVLRLGVDTRRAVGSLSEDAFIPATGALKERHHNGGRNDDVGLFAEDDVRLGAVTLTAGGRADHWAIEDGYIITTSPVGKATTDNHYASRAGWAVSGRTGAVWKLARVLTARASAYSGFRQPTLNELYRTFTVSPVTYGANPNLVNEQLKGYEGGIDFTPRPGIHVNATVFYNRVEHAIANVTIGPNIAMRENVQAIRARGVEVDAGAVWRQFTLDASWALTNSVVEAPGASINDLRPAQTPRTNAWVTLGWAPRAHWQFNAVLCHTGAEFEDDLHTSVLPEATTIGAFASVPLGRQCSLILRGENLADVAVETRNQNGSIDLAVPRTVWVGVRVGMQ